MAFPSISTGAHRYPTDKTSRIVLRTVKEFLEKEDKLDEVIFALFTKHDLKIYREVGEEIL